MKQIKLIISLLFVFSFVSHAQENCDTLKWNAIKTYYSVIDGTGTSFDIIGDLDGMTINIDTLSAFYPVLEFVNISNDTFSASGTISIVLVCHFYADTGRVASTFDAVKYPSFHEDVFPNDTIGFVYAKEFNILFFINQLKTQSGIDLEQISYWEIIMGIGYTSKDGYYSESIIYAGADTSIFYVVRGNNAIPEIENPSIISVYPNPTTNQLQITNYELREGTADYTIYNIVGQKVLQGKLQNEISIINVESLAKGLYYLRIAEKTVKFIKE